MAETKTDKKKTEKKVTAKEVEKKTLTKQEQKMYEPVSVQPQMITQIDTMKLADLEYEYLVELGRTVMEVKTFVQWTFGRLGDAVTEKYGDLKQYAKDINYNYDSLKSYTYVYRKFIKESPDFHPDKYMGSVPWGMLQVVAGSSERLNMPPEKLLNKLLDEGVNTQHGAYAKIKQTETGKIIPKKPVVYFEWDDKKELYKMTIKQPDLAIIDWDGFRDAHNKNILKG